MCVKKKIVLVIDILSWSCEHPFVPAKNRKPRHQADGGAARPVGLRELARHLGLSPTTISLVLNASPASEAIPAATKQRVVEAARRLNYRPSFLARSLRARRTFAAGVMVPELSEGYAALVVAGIEQVLMQRGYMCLATSHRHSARQVESVVRQLSERQVEGLILVDTPYPVHAAIPVVSVSGHGEDPGVLNINLDHDAAAAAGIQHLMSLGHRSIAVIRGQSFSSDTAVRWEAIARAARDRGIAIDDQLVVQLEGDSPSPATGYAAAQRLLARGVRFTALFAFNDISAFGAIRAFQERGLRVPDAVSVIGFDDIWGAAYHIPALTTIRQPLRRMGELAAEKLIELIGADSGNKPAAAVRVAPELIVRESTGPVGRWPRARAAC